MKYKISICFIVFTLYTLSGSEELAETDTTNDESLSRVRRSGFSMLRLGRGLQMLRLGKRSALPMLRMGRSVGDTLSDEDLEYLLNLVRNDRQVPLPRYGKDLALQYMLINALKNAESSSYDDDMQANFGFGYDLELPPGRQIRPAPRPGRYRRSAEMGKVEGTDTKASYAGGDQVYDDLDNSEERNDMVRVAPLMRYGKYINYDLDDEDVDKRAMRMLRLGRGMRMLRLGKRPEESDEFTEEEKRALRLLRLGKRPFNMLRMGRGDPEEEKRAFHMLRMGRSDLEEDKRAFHMLRMGRSDNEEEKRALNLLRLGKKSEEDKAR